MDEERQRKIEAGRSKWAKFKSKKNKNCMLNSSTDAVISHIQEKSCPEDPGGTNNKESQRPTESVANESSQSKLQSNLKDTKFKEFGSDNDDISISNQINPEMASSPHKSALDPEPDLAGNSTTNLSIDSVNQSRLQSNSSLDSSTEGTVDGSESSSGSDNSTITGTITYDSSKSDSNTEIDYEEKSADEIALDNGQQPESHCNLETENHNLPDEEKILQSIEAKETIDDNLQAESVLDSESVSKSSLLIPENKVPATYCTEMLLPSVNDIEDQNRSLSEMEDSLKVKSLLSEDVNLSLNELLTVTEIDDEPIPLLDAKVVSVFHKKVIKYQEAISQRDSIISKLSNRLESAMKANQAADTSESSQVDAWKDEINLLHLKLKEMAEVVKKQKQRNGSTEYQTFACQTDDVECCRCEASIQVETSISSLLQSCDLDETSFIELFKNKYFLESESLPEAIPKLKELLLNCFSPVHIQELMTSLKKEISVQESENIPRESKVVPPSDNEFQISEKMDSATILKKINSLNIVAKLIESLISISSGNANDTFLDFTPSKFQSFFLKRLHSSDTGDVLQDMSENESLLSDINYAEIESPCNKPPVDSALSIEKLRLKNMSEDFSLVTEFLQEEMDRLCSHIAPSPVGPQGDTADSQGGLENKENASGVPETGADLDHQKILLNKSKLETRLKNLKLLDRELHDVAPIPHQLSMDSDTMTMSEDNLLKEEFPSCISLVSSVVSLTDSEYRGDNIMTDSETNYSRKVSLDMSRSMQEKDFCVRCERNVESWKEKYESEMVCIKEAMEKSFNAQKVEFLEAVKSLESEINHLRTEKENLNVEFSKQVEILSAESENKLKNLSEEYENELSELKINRSKLDVEKVELEAKLKELEEKLTFSSRKIRETLDEKASIEIALQNQIADLIQEHDQDLKALKSENEAKLALEKKHLENNYRSSVEVLKKVHEDEITDLKCQIQKEYEEREQNLLNEHAKTISVIEAAHSDESAVYQKKIEQLLEEKCELLTKTTQEYETILKKNHRALVILCRRFLSKISAEKEKIINESMRSGGDLDLSFAAFDELNKNLEEGLVKFLNQNYFIGSNNEEFLPDETEYLPIELSYPVEEDDMPLKIDIKEFMNKGKINEGAKSNLGTSGRTCSYPAESSIDSDDIYTIHTEINKLQEEFQKDVAFYKDVNDQLHQEIKTLKKQNQELQNNKESLEIQLQEKGKELANKESMLSAMDAASVKGGSQLSASDIRSWQVQAAQTNSRLLHVLSELLKTFLDIEQEINQHLLEFGLIPSRSGVLAQHHDDDTGQSVGSREDFTSLSLGDCQNLELTEDGPDLTPRAWDVFITAGNYDNDLEGEDVVLGASRRLRLAVDHVLNLLSRALENQQSQDLKVLLKRNEELSHELQEESQGRDAVHMELVNAESTVRKLESEKQRLEDLNRNLKEDYDILKRELSVERSKMSHLQQEKESAIDEIQVLKEQCGLLASRLGDPEKTENDKMLISSGTCMHENSELLQENSRLSSEKQNVQKNLSKERQSFIDRLHQMEIALDELNAEKDDLVEKKCKEIRDLKAEMEAMEKQLQSNKKFLEQQAVEREQEREEFIKEITRMQDFVREKEKIQSNEAQLTKEIESLEQLLQGRIEDHRNVMAKKDEVEKELRHSVDKIRDLREIIEELEKQLDMKNRIETGLRQKLASISDSIPSQDKNSSLSDSGDSSKNSNVNGESMEQLHSLQEQLASQSQDIEMMAQSQTLLHELRGQIHFLEAKVEQRARLLESSFVSAASSPLQSGATSPSGSQDSESLQIPCEDGWEMSPRSIHWLEVRRLEEKIGRLAHLDEELLKRNKELESQMKKMKASYSETQQENAVLQEQLSEQLMQVSALKSHIDEQKHLCSTPQKTHSFAEKVEELQEQLEKQIENNKRMISDLQEARSTVTALQEEIRKKDEMISQLQKLTDQIKQNSFEEEVSDVSSIDDLKNQLLDYMKLIEERENEIEKLKSDIDYLKTENSSLKHLLEKAEKEAETEKAQVEALYEEISSLAENSKRLEQDFNTVQDMMHQKERELATLHEETEAQLKLEAEIETLVKKLSDQKSVEQELREEIEELRSQLNLSKVIKEEIEKRDLFIKDLKKSHRNELYNLNQKLMVLKNLETVKESDYDVKALVKNILEATDAFKTKEDNQSLQEVLINMLQNSVDTVIKQMKLNHEEQVSSINASWQEKISEEISHKNRYKSEAETLQKTFQTEKEKLASEKDAYWQEKMREMELKLTTEKISHDKFCDSAKTIKTELQSLYTKEISSLHQNLGSALKEKISLNNIVKDLQGEVERLKLAEKDQRAMISKEYEIKMSAISKTIKESFESEKKKILSACQQKIDQLQNELELKVQQVKSMELKHNEELSAIHKYFEARWENEIKKVKDFQSEDLKKLKDSNERMFEDKLKAAREQFAILNAEQKKRELLKHKQELDQLQEKFNQERKILLEEKDKAVKEATDIFEKRFNENLIEIQKNLSRSNHDKLSSEEQSRRNWEEEKLKLVSSHQKEMSAFKQELKNRYEKQLQMQSAAHQAEIKQLEESYNKQVEEVHNMIKEAKQAASRTGYSDTGSNRTTTPSSDMTSSDEACSSCREDMLAVNKHILVDKIHQDGKRVLSLVESSAQPFSSVKEAHLWLEERKWIVNKLKAITPITSNANLKIIISNLVDEIKKFRTNFEAALEENAELKRKYDDLEQQSSIQYSKLCEVNVQLKRQKAAQIELESVLDRKTSELSEVKNKLAEANRSIRVPAEKETFMPNSGSIGSSPSYEIGCLRSADDPRSADKFSLFLPEIGNTPSFEERTPSNKLSQLPEMSIPRIDFSSLVSVQTVTPPEVVEASVLDDMSQVRKRLMDVVDKGVDTTDAKLHGLYWVFRRSQSYNKALIYQKKYLLMLLKGFLMTERVTLAWLKYMNADKPSSPAGDFLLTPRARFRSAVFVIIALQRMKFNVKRWRLLARIPSSQIINVEIQSVFQNYSFLSPAISPGLYHLSSQSLASVPTSLVGREYKSGHMSSSSSRTENKFKNSSNPDKSQLIEYVHRLEVLQRQLGLDSLR